MSKDIQQLLQECLEGYDAGLTPEECLSAYPHVRGELEPLLRQALSLRVAYAGSPRAEFRVQARERLLFAAGRDVQRALSAEPDPQFVNTTRQRLLNRAGAGAQEALRDVPPPRLPFWMNARRHLLEAASAAPPQPVHHMAVGMRSALSAAVIVLAVAIAGAGFFLQNSPANQPPIAAVGAELDYISEQLSAFEELRATGQAVSSSQLDDLATRTNRLAEQVASSNDAEMKEKVLSEIERQRNFLPQEGTLDESLAAVQQRLAEADEKLSTSTIPEPTSTAATAAIVQTTPQPTVVNTPAPTATATVPAISDIEIVSSEDLSARQFVYQYDASETTFDLRWWRLTTSTLSFLMPESWTIQNQEEDENGLAVFLVDYIFIQTDVDDIMLVIGLLDGEVIGLIDGEAYTLRAEGLGTIIDPVVLSSLTDSTDWPVLYKMLSSLELRSQSEPGTDLEDAP